MTRERLDQKATRVIEGFKVSKDLKVRRVSEGLRDQQGLEGNLGRKECRGRKANAATRLPLSAFAKARFFTNRN